MNRNAQERSVPCTGIINTDHDELNTALSLLSPNNCPPTLPHIHTQWLAHDVVSFNSTLSASQAGRSCHYTVNLITKLHSRQFGQLTVKQINILQVIHRTTWLSSLGSRVGFGGKLVQYVHVPSYQVHTDMASHSGTSWLKLQYLSQLSLSLEWKADLQQCSASTPSLQCCTVCCN